MPDQSNSTQLSVTLTQDGDAATLELPEGVKVFTIRLGASQIQLHDDGQANA